MEISKKQWKTYYKEQIKLGTCYCYLCGRMIKDESDFNIDHMTPTSRGGQNEASNWRASHRVCNSQKGALTYDEYREWLRLENIRNGGKIR